MMARVLPLEKVKSIDAKDGHGIQYGHQQQVKNHAFLRNIRFAGKQRFFEFRIHGSDFDLG